MLEQGWKNSRTLRADHYYSLIRLIGYWSHHIEKFTFNANDSGLHGSKPSLHLCWETRLVLDNHWIPASFYIQDKQVKGLSLHWERCIFDSYPQDHLHQKDTVFSNSIFQIILRKAHYGISVICGEVLWSMVWGRATAEITRLFGRHEGVTSGRTSHGPWYAYMHCVTNVWRLYHWKHLLKKSLSKPGTVTHIYHLSPLVRHRQGD